MLRLSALVVSFCLSVFLAACGGGNGSSPTSAQAGPGATSLTAAHTFVARDYHPVVQQLYVAYFGRPADPAGLANFASELSGTHTSNDIQDLNAAYHRDSRVRSLIDSFGLSPESNALYSGDTVAFITAIYRNVLNRLPDADGLAFWVEAIDRRGLSRANASFSIMAGALANSSSQGRVDAMLINRRITAASEFTATLSAEARVDDYRGDAAAGIARNMLAKITDASDLPAIRSAIGSTLSLLRSEAPGAPAPVPDAFTAAVSLAPPDGASISGVQRIELRGSGIRNAELLPAAGVVPIYARFNIASDNRSAWVDLDTSTLSNGPLAFRIVAWDVRPGGSGQSVVAMPARTWMIENAPPPISFNAVLIQAPFDGANLFGTVTLEVQGSGLGNVELLPENGYAPVLGRFAVARDGMSARLDFDTRTVPNYLLRSRIVAFNAPPGTAGASEIVVMPARSWWLHNQPPPVGTPEGRAARCLSSGRQHTRLSDPWPVLCIYEYMTIPYEQCKGGWGMLYSDPEVSLPVLRDGRFVSKLYCSPGAYGGTVNLGCSCT